MYVNAGYEYWGRAGSLIHTTIDGSRDVDAMPNKRIYLQAAGQHGTGGFPPRENNRVTDGPVYRDNSLDIELRAPLATYTP